MYLEHLETAKRNILIAPLNWGLGHATRCVPIIYELEKNGFNVIIASDGDALQMLQKEFPNLLCLTLPSYNIKYPENNNSFIWQMIKNCPKIIQAILTEKRIVKKWIKKYNLVGIISDNRLGVYSKIIPCVFITHQLKVLSGNTTWFSTKIHHYFIKKYTECWVPDTKKKPNLTGKLGHAKKSGLKVKYIGSLSRLTKKELLIKYHLMVILSGPEPQRTILEEKLKLEMQRFDGKVVFVKGVMETNQKIETFENVTFYNYMTTQELENTFNQSEIVLCRSGYTTIMDLAKLEKKAFFIPTPGQFEQEYLAKKMKQAGYVPYANQKDFKIENLSEIELYKGVVNQMKAETNWSKLLMLFKGE